MTSASRTKISSACGFGIKVGSLDCMVAPFKQAFIVSNVDSVQGLVILALLWQILSGTGFPNQFFCDSWVVGFWRGRPWLAGRRIGKKSLDAFSSRPSVVTGGHLGTEIFDGCRYPKQSEDEDREVINPHCHDHSGRHRRHVHHHETALTPSPPLGAIPTFGRRCAA